MASSRSPHETTLHEILEALDAGTDSAAIQAVPCAICRLTARSVERGIRAVFAEFVNDPDTRNALRASRGFCAHHTPLLAELGDALAVAILYSDLADQTRMRWEAGDGRRVRSLGRFTKKPHAPCPACAAAEEAARRYSHALAQGLDHPDVWGALENGEGLCVTHVEQVAAEARPEAAARLTALEGRRLAALQIEMEEIIRKNDYRFRGEPWGPEKDAWLRALKKLRGGNPT